MDRLERVIHEHNWEGKETSYGELLSEYRTLLYHLNEHFDACYSALRSVCAPLEGKPPLFDEAFLDKANPPGWRAFRDGIRGYKRDHIGALVNAMKHRQGELCTVFFYSSMEFRPGYYLRDVLPTGALGPSPALHNGGETAFSFARDLMLHLWWLYKSGDLLATALDTILRVVHKEQVQERAAAFDHANLGLLLKRCAGVRPEFFPDETSKPYPRIVCRPDLTALSLEFPTTARGHRVKEMRISTVLGVAVASYKASPPIQ